MNTYLRSLYFCFFLVPLVAMGQVVDLRQAPYNMTAADTVTLDKRFTSFAAAKASPALSAFCGWLEYVGAAATWNQWRLHEAYPRNAQWANDDYVGVTHYQNGLGSKAALIYPAGEYLMSHYIIKCQAAIWCAGSGGFFDANPGAGGGTTFILDRARWKGDPGDNSGIKCCFKDVLWGNLQNSGYMEGSGLYGCKIIGQSADFYDPNVHESGILCWTAGEQYNIEDVHIYNFNDYGVEMQGTRHATFSATRLSVFKCNKAGIGVIAGGHLQLYLSSFDDNPAAYEAIPDAAGSIGNGTFINSYGVKFETGKTDARPYSKGQLLLKGKGWIKANFFGCSYSCVNSKPPYLFEIETTQNVSHVNLYGTDWFDAPGYLLHDQTRNELIGMDSDARADFTTSNITDFKWRSDGWFEAPGCSLKVTTGVSDTRLAPLQRVYDAVAKRSVFVGSWNLTAGTPAYSYTTAMAGEPGAPPPPTGTPCTGWGMPNFAGIPCIGGIQTAPEVRLPAGCNTTPPGTKPNYTQTCTAGGGSGTWTELWKGTTVAKSTCTPANKVATQVRLTNWKPTAGGRIVGTGVGKPSVELWNGDFYFNNVKCTSSVGKITLGQLYPSVTITLPKDASGNTMQIAIVAAWQVQCESTFSYGGACPGSCEKLEAQ